MTELPTTFGKYFLTEKLATGGMAEIYLAKIMGPGGFEKQLVIKQIHPRLSGQRHFVDLFVAEAKTLVTLAHGNIVPVYELGVIDDTYFIAMEYIDGPTLYRLTERLASKGARMAPALAAWIAAKILEGLDYAHRKGEGVIHRDLSPRNVMLSRDGEVKLVDFGIAVTLGGGGEGGEEAAPTGSFPYMSPEQVRKEALSGQTDLFSVGVLLWEMLAGKRLFARSDADATLAAVTESDIARPSAVHADVPAKLDEVAMRALERDTTARWASAGEMLAALQRFLYALDETPSPRDVSALVARYCPPETRRQPTHAEHAIESPAPPPPAGPATAVVPREAVPRGKRARTESFATNVDLEQLLEGPPPPSTVVSPRAPDAEHQTDRSSSDDDSAQNRQTDRSTEGDHDAPTTTVAPPRERAIPRPDRAPLTVPGRAPPSRVGLILAGIGATVLAVGAVFVFLRGRESVYRPDAAPKYDAPYYMFDPDARGPHPLDAPTADAAEATPSPSDAPTAPPDAARLPRTHDATPLPLDAHAAATGKATLRIGAVPWGDVVIDGAKRGRTPNDFVVDAGHHVVEVVYGGEDPPRRKTFRIDVATGETQELQADFTSP